MSRGCEYVRDELITHTGSIAVHVIDNDEAVFKSYVVKYIQ